MGIKFPENVESHFPLKRLDLYLPHLRNNSAVKAKSQNPT